MSLSDGQLVALRNLALKKGGQAVPWINIADAQALTEMGLALRNREGWIITPAGAKRLAELEGASEPPGANDAAPGGV